MNPKYLFLSFIIVSFFSSCQRREFSGISPERCLSVESEEQRYLSQADRATEFMNIGRIGGTEELVESKVDKKCESPKANRERSKASEVDFNRIPAYKSQHNSDRLSPKNRRSSSCRSIRRQLFGADLSSLENTDLSISTQGPVSPKKIWPWIAQEEAIGRIRQLKLSNRQRNEVHSNNIDAVTKAREDYLAKVTKRAKYLDAIDAIKKSFELGGPSKSKVATRGFEKVCDAPLIYSFVKNLFGYMDRLMIEAPELYEERICAYLDILLSSIAENLKTRDLLESELNKSRLGESILSETDVFSILVPILIEVIDQKGLLSLLYEIEAQLLEVDLGANPAFLREVTTSKDIHLFLDSSVEVDLSLFSKLAAESRELIMDLISCEAAVKQEPVDCCLGAAEDLESCRVVSRELGGQLKEGAEEAIEARTEILFCMSQTQLNRICRDQWSVSPRGGVTETANIAAVVGMPEMVTAADDVTEDRLPATGESRTAGELSIIGKTAIENGASIMAEKSKSDQSSLEVAVPAVHEAQKGSSMSGKLEADGVILTTDEALEDKNLGIQKQKGKTVVVDYDRTSSEDPDHTDAAGISAMTSRESTEIPVLSSAILGNRRSRIGEFQKHSNLSKKAEAVSKVLDPVLSPIPNIRSSFVEDASQNYLEPETEAPSRFDLSNSPAESSGTSLKSGDRDLVYGLWSSNKAKFEEQMQKRKELANRILQQNNRDRVILKYLQSDRLGSKELASTASPSSAGKTVSRSASSPGLARNALTPKR